MLEKFLVVVGMLAVAVGIAGLTRWMNGRAAAHRRRQVSRTRQAFAEVAALTGLIVEERPVAGGEFPELSGRCGGFDVRVSVGSWSSEGFSPDTYFETRISVAAPAGARWPALGRLGGATEQRLEPEASKLCGELAPRVASIEIEPETIRAALAGKKVRPRLGFAYQLVLDPVAINWALERLSALAACLGSRES